VKKGAAACIIIGFGLNGFWFFYIVSMQMLCEDDWFVILASCTCDTTPLCYCREGRQWLCKISILWIIVFHRNYSTSFVVHRGIPE
jgi:hypothetical protein